LQKQSEWQDVETVEDSKVCAIGQNICYGTMVITAVNLTLNAHCCLEEDVSPMTYPQKLGLAIFKSTPSGDIKKSLFEILNVPSWEFGGFLFV
jgi:hypothetical protein